MSKQFLENEALACAVRACHEGIEVRRLLWLMYRSQSAHRIGEGMVEVGPAGAVVSWTWVAEPRKQQPFEHPFAYALIQLDGADVPMLHVVDAGSAERMSTGMRVRPRWSDDPQGGILDLARLEPEA